MKAVLYFAPGDLRLVESPVPKPGPGEVVVKIEAALTCGTDFKAYRQGHPVLLGKLPAPFGHEFSGVIAETGRGVKKFKEGDRVVVGNSAPCEKCFFCARNQSQLCENLKLHNGGYAEFNRVPAAIVKHKMFKTPSSLSFEKAALSEPLACAVHGVAALGVQKGETTTVIGAGPMAHLLIQTLRASGSRVIVVGRSEDGLSRAKACGANHVLSTLETNWKEKFRALTSGRGADCVFEAVGTAETWTTATLLARKGGRICLFAGCAPKTQVSVDARRLHYDELSLFGVFHHNPDYFAQAVRLLASGKIKTTPLIAGKIALSDIPSYFAKHRDRPGPKVAVIP
jgi:L-iditol 2-dehydrogenase